MAQYKQTAREQRFERWLRSRGYEVRPALILGVQLKKVLQSLIDERAQAATSAPTESDR